MSKNLLISTGGSGGHVVPATIFYEHLKKEFEVCITSDKRGTQFLNKDLPLLRKSISNHEKTNYNIFSCYLSVF